MLISMILRYIILFPIYTDENYKAKRGLLACPEGLVSDGV